VDPEQNYWRWPRFRGIGTAIGHVSVYEHQYGRPLLSALVVHAGTMHAGDGFAQLARDLGYQIQPDQDRAYWRGQVEAVVQCWHGPGRDSTPQNDRDTKIRSLVSNAMSQLAEVTRLLEA